MEAFQPAILSLRARLATRRVLVTWSKLVLRIAVFLFVYPGERGAANGYLLRCLELLVGRHASTQTVMASRHPLANGGVQVSM